MGILKAIRNYRELGHEEFTRRLKEGIERTSQLSKVKSQFFGHPFILIGIILGIYITMRTKTYWLTLILFGSLILELVSLFGLYQQYLILKKQEKIFEEMNNGNK